MIPATRRLTAGLVAAIVVVALFTVGFLGWLVRGGGDDETVPTIAPTTAPVAPITPAIIAPTTTPAATLPPATGP